VHATCDHRWPPSLHLGYNDQPLVLFTEIFAVYCEGHKSIVWANGELLNFTAGDTNQLTYRHTSLSVRVPSHPRGHFVHSRFIYRRFRWFLYSVEWKGEQWTVNSEQWTVNSEQWPVSSEQWTVISEQWAVNSEQWTVNSEQWAVNSEQWTVNSEQWTVSSEQWPVSSEQWTVNNEMNSVAGTCLGRTWGTIPASSWRDWGKPATPSSQDSRYRAKFESRTSPIGNEFPFPRPPPPPTGRSVSTLLASKQLKIKQSLYRPGQALRAAAGWGCQISRQSAHEGGKVVSTTHRPPLPQEIFLLPISVRRWVEPQGHSAAGRIASMKNSSDNHREANPASKELQIWSSQGDDFWDVTFGDLGEFYQRFGGVFCPRRRQPPKRWQTLSRMYDITS
jgi:hypothetical protein